MGNEVGADRRSARGVRALDRNHLDGCRRRVAVALREKHTERRPQGYLRNVMKFWTASVALIALCLAFAQPVSGQTFTDPQFSTEVIATLEAYNLVGLDWAPDGRIFIWEKNGVIRIIK